MKKLLFILLMFVGLSAFSQTEKIVTYKINTTGSSNGLIIPSPFYFHVDALTAKIGETGFQLYSYTSTTTDQSGTVIVGNDSISEMKVYNITIAEVDTMTLDGMIESRIKANLESIYGAPNVTKVE